MLNKNASIKAIFLLILSCLGIILYSCKNNKKSHTAYYTIKNKQLAVTIDDLPVMAYSKNQDIKHWELITNQLLNTCHKYQVPVIGYVNEAKLYTNNKLDSNKVNILERWLINGFELGNHTFSHLNYHKVDFDTYTNDIIKGEEVIQSLAIKYPKQPIRFFRHPSLMIGKSQSQYDSLKNFLVNHGYTEAPVTLDNDDYRFAKAYHLAFVNNNQKDLKKIASDYLHHMEQKLLYYENSSMELFGRNINHILLLHANLLNAHHLDKLLAMYQKHGYKFITQQKALSDEVYTTKFKYYRDWSNSWLDRWAFDQGKQLEYFEKDPQTPLYIKRYPQTHLNKN